MKVTKIFKRFRYDLFWIVLYVFMIVSPIFYDDWEFITYLGIALGSLGLGLTAYSIYKDEPSRSLFSFAELMRDIREINARRK